jgi:hypothetical protein
MEIAGRHHTLPAGQRNSQVLDQINRIKESYMLKASEMPTRSLPGLRGAIRTAFIASAMMVACSGNALAAEGSKLRFSYQFLQPGAISDATPAGQDGATPMVAPDPAMRAAAACKWEISPRHGVIRNSFDKWATSADWQIYWELPIDIPIELGATFCGSFEDAVETVLTSFATSDTPIRGVFYRGNRVVRFVSGAK